MIDFVYEQSASWKEGSKFEAGANMAGAIDLLLSSGLSRKIGMDAIEAHEQELITCLSKNCRPLKV